MNPREMTNEEFAAAVEKRCEFNHDGVTMTELRRRLNEIDALRKENEELRDDKARLDFLDDGNYGYDPRIIPGVRMDGRRFHCLAGRGDWNTLREAIDAARLAEKSDAEEGR